MQESILNTIKTKLGLSSDMKEFDEDILVHINSAFMILHQLGVGPEEEFFIEDEEAIWKDFMGEDMNRFQSVKLYIFYKVKLGFDPYASSGVNTQMQNYVEELEWRLRVKQELEEIEKEKGEKDDST